VAAEGLPLSFWHFFHPIGKTINAASVLPNLLRDFGDMSAILAEVAPRKVLLAAGIGKLSRQPQSVALTDRSFAETPATLLDWLGEGSSAIGTLGRVVSCPLGSREAFPSIQPPNSP